MARTKTDGSSPQRAWSNREDSTRMSLAYVLSKAQSSENRENKIEQMRLVVPGEAHGSESTQLSTVPDLNSRAPNTPSESTETSARRFL